VEFHHNENITPEMVAAVREAIQEHVGKGHDSVVLELPIAAYINLCTVAMVGWHVAELDAQAKVAALTSITWMIQQATEMDEAFGQFLSAAFNTFANDAEKIRAQVDGKNASSKSTAGPGWLVRVARCYLKLARSFYRWAKSPSK